MVQDRSIIEGVGGGNPIKTKPDDSVLISELDQSKIAMSASRQGRGGEQLKRSELEDDAPEGESSDDQEDKDRGVTFGKK